MRTLLLHTAMTAFACTALACSSADDEGGTGAEQEPSGPMGPSTDPSDPVEPPAASDNECGINSGYPGDELCILPPDPSEGIQLSVGPVDYDDPEEVASYLLEPGGEDVVCYNSAPAAAGGFHFLEQRNRMRSGSHHMLIALKDAGGLERGRVTSQAECEGFSGRIGSIPGSQTPIDDFLSDDFAPEDEGLGRWFPENAVATYQLHYVNTGEETVMREAWTNLRFKADADVTESLNSIFLVGDLAVSVPPQTRQVTPLSFSPSLTEPVRVFEVGAHSHAHTERFTVWKNRGGAAETQLYESYDWAEPIVLRLNSVIENPLPDPSALTDGGVSGITFIDPGDTLDFECEVNNTTDQTLNFANEAYTAEMCLLSGAYVGNVSGMFTGGCASGSCSNFAFGGGQ